MSSLQDRVAAALETASGAAVLLSENPAHDSGGGQRSAHFAAELLDRDYAVFFVARGRVTEVSEPGTQPAHPRLVEAALPAAVGLDGLAAIRALCSGRPSFLLTQPPVGAWVPAIEVARDVGAVTVYDCMDPWSGELGRAWHDADAERSIARAADVVVASAPLLVEHTERLTGRASHLLPNAFDARIFRREGPWDRPDDLPEDARIALFVGALRGRWLDWRLVRAAVDARPETTFVFVGDHRGEGGALPARCHFVGLKQHRDLPAYLAHADVAFLPWHVTQACSSMSPLTVYEHVGMGLPVVSTPVETVRRMPGVTLAPDADAFAEALGRVDRNALDEPTMDAMSEFAADSTFGRRVDRLLDLVESQRRPATAPSRDARRPTARARTSVSVIVPSYQHERYVGEAIDSVREQSLPPGELVVVDDGSTDRSTEVIRRHAFAGMRLLEQPNVGAHRTLNRGISLADGAYVAVLNSDDAFEPERIEHAWGVARDTGAALLVGSVQLVDALGTPLPDDHETARWYRSARRDVTSAPNLRAGLARHNVAVTTSNFFFLKELWVRLGGFRPYRYVHDYDFLLRAIAFCPDRVVFVEELADVRYRVHDANTIHEDVGRALGERRLMRADHGGIARRLRARWHGWRASAALSGAVAASESWAPVVPSHARRSAVTGGRISRPLRVGLVTPSLDRGGLEEVVALLAEALPRADTRVDVLCTRSGGTVAERLRANGTAITLAGGRMEALRGWLDEARPDVLSTHFVSREEVEALTASGTPVVETVHNTYAWFGTDDWSEESRKIAHVAATIAVSEVVRRYYLARCGTLDDMHVVPNAVHPGRAAGVPRAYARRRVGVGASAPVVLHLGRLASQKNLVGLLDGFADARASVPELRLLLVGTEAEAGVLSALHARHADLFASGIVRRLPELSAVGVPLAAADVVVSNSFFEGWSVSASEALWVGTPVVLSDCGGAAELVGPDGARGILLPNPLGDASIAGPEAIAGPPPEALRANREALSSALVEIVRARADWRRRAPELRGWARSRLTPAGMADHYLSILRSVARR